VDSYNEAVYQLNYENLERRVQLMRRGLERFFIAEEMGPYGVLTQFEIIHFQESKLPPHFFEHFCQQLGLVAGSAEVKLLSKFGERSARIHIDTGHSAAAAKLYLVTSDTDAAFETYEKAAASYQCEVGDLREGILNEHLQKR